jgi:hypothetical protein
VEFAIAVKSLKMMKSLKMRKEIVGRCGSQLARQAFKKEARATFFGRTSSSCSFACLIVVIIIVVASIIMKVPSINPEGGHPQMSCLPVQPRFCCHPQMYCLLTVL